MRIDAISIFPDYFQALDLSLLGKAREKNILDFKVHDLRDFTHDKHRTVDDSPYGGGAGMLMKPEPWGEAFDEILDPNGDTIVIFTSPAGELFKQATAYELAEAKHIVFACGRYEGIDQRVVDYAATKAKVRMISLGDYVLNGGEVAAIAMTEAIARLIPGVIGNAESLVEESHSDGLLEYPSFTKPASWRGMDVPEVLTSGNHAAIAAWRRQQQVDRTKAVRPDLLPDGDSSV
jgi:tRNA (guanine37-N1)-methyltransferase